MKTDPPFSAPGVPVETPDAKIRLDPYMFVPKDIGD